MRARATAKWIRVSPRKVRLVLDLIRNKPYAEATRLLNSCNNKSSRLVSEVVSSAKANAKVISPGVRSEELYIREAFADGGVLMKRGRWRAMGRWCRINKPTSHITVVVGD